MVVGVVVFSALLAALVAGGRSACSADEPLAPCHTRVSSIDGQGHRLVTYTDETGDIGLAGTISEVAAAFNADLAKVRLVAAQNGDITINEATSGPAGRTTLTCFGQTRSSAIVINTAMLDLRSPSLALSRDLVVMHEFGHALGFAHTTQACALMHPNDSDCAKPELIRFTEGERRAVDALYFVEPAKRRQITDFATGWADALPGALAANLTARALRRLLASCPEGLPRSSSGARRSRPAR